MRLSTDGVCVKLLTRPPATIKPTHYPFPRLLGLWNFDLVAGQLPPAPFGAMGLTYPILGVVGVAGVRTVVGPVHATVPFGAERRVICRPCSRLIGKHGWHRWCVLVGQNRAQHPNFGFHFDFLICRSKGTIASVLCGIPRRVYRCPNHELLRRLEGDGILQKDIARTFGVSRWTIARWCRKLGILHHTTGRFRKGTTGNEPHIHEEMPFGIGVAFSDDLDLIWE